MNATFAVTTKRLAASALLAVAIFAISPGPVHAQPPGGRGGRGGGRAGFVAPLFTALDVDKDGAVTSSEMKSTFDGWYTTWSASGNLGQDQLLAGLNGVFGVVPGTPERGNGMNTFNAAGNTRVLVPEQAEVDAMMAALPTTPGAKPAKARKVLVFAHTGPGGFVHASIPLAAKTVDALGNKGDLWTTTVSYNPADITAANLKQYDAIFLDSNTTCFLDDVDPAVTTARRTAFLDFVRDGKGIAGIHAATDSYHSDCVAAWSAVKRGVAGGIGGTVANALSTQLMAQGDADKNGTLSRAEFAAAAGTWFAKLDKSNSGKVASADFDSGVIGLLTPPGGRGRGGEAAPVLQWPEFNKLIGGYFKFHWLDPQLIHVKIDDAKSPLTAMFHGQEFEIRDETYTFAQDSFSRSNVHVLTSINFDKMSAEDKAKESNPRTDGDYALSYIRREGKGRVFYEGHGHAARVYTMTPMLEHIRAGIQYALGDLKADDSPSKK